MNAADVIAFPLESWECFKVIAPEEHNALGGDLLCGIMHGKPGEMPEDVKARAIAADMCGLFKSHELRLDWINR